VPPLECPSERSNSMAIVSARSAVAVQATKCGTVENLRGATADFLCKLGSRISTALDDVGCLYMDDDSPERPRQRRQRGPLVVVEDPQLFPGGARGSDSAPIAEAPPKVLEDDREGRLPLVKELAHLFNLEQEDEVREEDMVNLLEQLVNLHAENYGCGDGDDRMHAVFSKIPNNCSPVPYRIFCHCLLNALDELTEECVLMQKEIMEQLIAVRNLEAVDAVDAPTNSPCKQDSPAKKLPAEFQKPASEESSTTTAPLRWVRQAPLTAIPERGESTVSGYEAIFQTPAKEAGLRAGLVQ